MAEIKKITLTSGKTAYCYRVYRGIHPLTEKKTNATRSFKTMREGYKT